MCATDCVESFPSDASWVTEQGIRRAEINSINSKRHRYAHASTCTVSYNVLPSSFYKTLVTSHIWGYSINGRSHRTVSCR